MASLQLIISLFLSLLSLSYASNISAIIVFGDSTVDSGNNNWVDTLAKANFPPYGRDFIGGVATGRFCNGKLATDILSETLGLGPEVPAYLDPSKSIKDFAKGVCFASAGTGLDNTTAAINNVIPMWKELEYYKEYITKLTNSFGEAQAKKIISEAVHLISIGSNDFFFYSTNRLLTLTLDQYEDFLMGLIKDFITELYNLGARKIVFFDLGPIGCVPFDRAFNLFGGCNEIFNDVAKNFNGKLSKVIEDLNGNLPGIMLRNAPIFYPVMDIMNNPSKYGFENVQDGCCGGKLELGFICALNAITCPNADKYVYFDAVHSTQKVNQIVADLLLKTSLKDFI